MNNSSMALFGSGCLTLVLIGSLFLYFLLRDLIDTQQLDWRIVNQFRLVLFISGGLIIIGEVGGILLLMILASKLT